MKSIHLLALFTFLPGTAPAQTDNEKSPAQLEKTFESPGFLESARFVPPELMSGTLHNVAPSAYNDGLVNTYVLYSGTDRLEISSTPALIERIREIYAIEYLRGLSKTEEFKNAIIKAGKGTLEGVANVVKDPVGTISRIPKGASRFFGRIGEGLKGGKSEMEDGGLKGILGVSQKKAELAVKLGVSPYSTNEALQHELNETARAMAGGGLLIGAATMPIGGGVGMAITGLKVDSTLQRALVTSTPEDLRIVNRKKLFALGLNREQADEFLMHPWYSPWCATITTDALASIGVDPAAFVANACRALTPEDAFYFQRLAQVLARYHTTKAPLRSIRIEDGIVCALDKSGTLVVPLSCDYAIWTERPARRAEEFTALAKSHNDIKGLALWVDGKTSERLGQELKSRHIDVAADVLAGL